MKITRLDVPQCSVGEGPVWDVGSQALYWIDILEKKVFRHDPATGGTRQWSVPQIIGSMAILQDGRGALVALANGVHTLDFASGECRMLATSADLNDRVQLADGKVDRRGRFIVGSSDRGMKESRGGLYVLDPGATALRRIDSDIFLANGPCWSPDDRLLYHADSIRRTIFVYDYDIHRGTASNRRPFASTAEFGGIPDGATVDAEGFLWSAICEGGRLVRFRPDGSVERTLQMPVRLPGSVMFGGPDLDRLYVTTLSPAFLGRPAEPLDGTSWVIEDLGIQGLPEPRFGAGSFTFKQKGVHMETNKQTSLLDQMGDVVEAVVEKAKVTGTAIVTTAGDAAGVAKTTALDTGKVVAITAKKARRVTVRTAKAAGRSTKRAVNKAARKIERATRAKPRRKLKAKAKAKAKARTRAVTRTVRKVKRRSAVRKVARKTRRRTARR